MDATWEISDMGNQVAKEHESLKLSMFVKDEFAC